MSVPAGPRGADADADVAGLGPRVALGHMRGRLDMARQHVTDHVARLQRRIERVDRGAGHAERLRHAFPLHHQNRRRAAVIRAMNPLQNLAPWRSAPATPPEPKTPQ